MSSFHLSLNKAVPERFRTYRARVVFVMGGLALAGLLLVWRAFDLQIVQHESLSALAQSQSQRTISLKGKRGEILDRTGRRLAASLLGVSLYAHPDQVENPSRTALRLSETLGVPHETLEERLTSKRSFVWLARQLLPDQAAPAQDLNIPGVRALQEYRRIYPGRFLASSVLGFTGIDSQGLEGLEYAYDSYLKGAEGLQVIDHDALGRRLLDSGERPLTGGGNIRLTLDPVIQSIADAELSAAVSHWGALRGTAVVMDSRNGEILAIAQAPAFNPNSYRDYDKETYFNRAVTAGYEPGSTFKIVTVAAALEARVAKPDSLYFCENGHFQFYDSVIHDTAEHGWLSLARVVQLSSNICAAKVGISIPSTVFHEFILSLGFGKRPGLATGPDGKQLAGEATGYVLEVNKWTPVDQAAMSFGHGILVSPVQLVAAINSVATGGWYVPPVLLREVRDSEGERVEGWPKPPRRRVMSATTAGTLRDFMEDVVYGEGGTGTHAAVPGYRVAGKTGTTEKYDLQARGYSKTQNIGSFVGFVPAANPRLTILVVIEEPSNARFGGTVAAPVFRDIAARSLPYLGVWPEDQVRRLALRGGETAVERPAVGERQMP
jgi:cell division protein FtsI (penicillin-binding protein 3)